MVFRMVWKSGQIFPPFCHNSRVWQSDRQTEFSSLDRVCIACNAVKILRNADVIRYDLNSANSRVNVGRQQCSTWQLTLEIADVTQEHDVDFTLRLFCSVSLRILLWYSVAAIIKDSIGTTRQAGMVMGGLQAAGDGWIWRQHSRDGVGWGQPSEYGMGIKFITVSFSIARPSRRCFLTHCRAYM